MGQSVRCTVTPRVRVTKPVMSSYGKGLQHSPIRVSKSPTPSTMTSVVGDVRSMGVFALRSGRCVLPGRQPPHDLSDSDDAAADGGLKVLLVVVAEHFGDVDLLDGLVEAAELALQQLLAALYIGAAFLLAEPRADRLARVGSLGHAQVRVEPIERRAARHAAREHLDLVAVLQRRVERDEPAIDLRADAPVAQFRVDPVREVDGSRAGRQLLDLVLRRVHEYLVVEKVGLERFHELVGGPFSAPLQQLAEPRQALLEAQVLVGAALLVAPVRRNSVLGYLVHLEGAHLDLHGQSAD